MRVSSIYSLVGINLPPSSCASNSFITASEIALWPFCFLTHQAAALTDNPFRYASINRKLRLQNLLSVSVGQASSAIGTCALQRVLEWKGFRSWRFGVKICPSKL